MTFNNKNNNKELNHMASCCTIGTTEHDTLLNDLKWSSEWLESLAKDMQIVLSSLASIAGPVNGSLHTNHMESTVDSLAIELDAYRVLVGALLNRIATSYEDSTRGTSILPALVHQAHDKHEESKGCQPIPIMGGYGLNIPNIKGLKDYNSVFIAGNSSFFYRRNHYDILKYIADEIVQKSKWMEPLPLMLIFHDESVLELLSERPDNNGKSVLEVLQETYPGIRFLHHKDEIVEYKGNIKFVDTKPDLPF